MQGFQEFPQIKYQETNKETQDTCVLNVIHNHKDQNCCFCCCFTSNNNKLGDSHNCCSSHYNSNGEDNDNGVQCNDDSGQDNNCSAWYNKHDGQNGNNDDQDDGDDEGGGNNDDHSDGEFASILSYLLLLLLVILLSLLHYFYLVTYNLLMRQVFRCIWHATHLFSRGTRVACISNNSYQNTFRSSNTTHTVAVFKSDMHSFRIRYGQGVIILQDKLFIKPLVFQECLYETANCNFQTLQLMKIITCNFHTVQSKDHIVVYCQYNAPIILINYDKRLNLIFLRMQRKQSLFFIWQWAWFDSDFHEILLLILHETKYGKYKIIAIRCQNVNNMVCVISRTLLLKQIVQVTYFLCICNNLQPSRILSTQLHRSARKLLLNDGISNHSTCKAQLFIMLWLMICSNESIAVVYNKHIIWFMNRNQHLFVSNTSVTTNALQSGTTLYKSVYNLHQHVLRLLRSSNRYFVLLITKQNYVHLTDIQLRIFLGYNNHFSTLPFCKLAFYHDNNFYSNEMSMSKLVYHIHQLVQELQLSNKAVLALSSHYSRIAIDNIVLFVVLTNGHFRILFITLNGREDKPSTRFLIERNKHYDDTFIIPSASLPSTGNTSLHRRHFESIHSFRNISTLNQKTRRHHYNKLYILIM